MHRHRRPDDGCIATKRPVDMNTWILELPRTVPVSLLRALHRHIQLLPVGVVSEVTASWPPDGGSCLARKLRPGHCQVTPTAQHLPARHIFPVCALGLKTSITACCCRPVVHQYHKAHSVGGEMEAVIFVGLTQIYSQVRRTVDAVYYNFWQLAVSLCS